MALHSISRLDPPPLPPMLDGVEFYVTECENAMSPESTPFHESAEPFRACTVLVSFAKSYADRAALRPLLTALAFGQTSSAVCDGVEWLQSLPKRLLERLKAADHGLVVAVMYAGSDGDSDAVSVQAAADALRQCFGASLAALLVTTGDSAHQLSWVTGVSGFVVGVSGTNAETALSVFLCLAMLSAPKTLNGIDLVDLLPVLGTASAPTVLANALWLRQGEVDWSLHLLPMHPPCAAPRASLWSRESRARGVGRNCADSAKQLKPRPSRGLARSSLQLTGLLRRAFSPPRSAWCPSSARHMPGR